MLALESVRRGLFKNQRILMVCFNSLLGNWLASQLPQNEPDNRVTAGSFHQILARISSVSAEMIWSEPLRLDTLG
jgi:hypothetical protein